MRFTALVSLVTLLLTGTAFAQDSYVRFQQGPTPRDAALQCAVGTFGHAEKKVQVVLYGVVHIADADYYARVQEDLDSYDVVLYEGVAPGKTQPTEEDKSLGDIQKMMGEMLGLSFQKDGIDYKRPNLVHADMNMDQLKEALGGSTINPLGNVMDENQLKAMAPMLKMIGQFGKMFLANNPRMQDQVKLMMGKQLSQADLQAAMPKQFAQAILIERNKVVMEVLNKELAKRDDGTIAIFYGAAHNPDFEERLAALGFTRNNKRWMTAWTIGEGVETSLDDAPGLGKETTPTTPTKTKPRTEPKEGPRWF